MTIVNLFESMICNTILKNSLLKKILFNFKFTVFILYFNTRILKCNYELLFFCLIFLYLKDIFKNQNNTIKLNYAFYNLIFYYPSIYGLFHLLI